MNLTIISHFQSIHVTQRIKQAVGIMEYYDSITTTKSSVIR